ncbi:hypothetical protein E4U33_002184, partial [Claviceps sp. LM78 group G4]
MSHGYARKRQCHGPRDKIIEGRCNIKLSNQPLHLVLRIWKGATGQFPRQHILPGFPKNAAAAPPFRRPEVFAFAYVFFSTIIDA